MQVIKAVFNDFDVYNETVEDWKLVYNILSKRDFKVKLNMFTGDNFAISRIVLQGKLIHSGSSPIGFKTIVIPINYNDKFIWYNKGSGGNEILILNKECVLDAVTFNNFDAYVVSIENDFFYNTINELNYAKCRKRFNSLEQELHLTKIFVKKLHKLAGNFLNNYVKNENFSITNQHKHNALVNEIIYELLTYIENAQTKKKPISKNKIEAALIEAVEIIENDQENLYSIKELSVLTNISERSLLYAFKEKYKVSPSEFIKASRLNKVKNELFALKGKSISIATIAGKHQFWHMGQFAKDFKKQFGILPSKMVNK